MKLTQTLDWKLTTHISPSLKAIESLGCKCNLYDVNKLTHFLHYWPFVRPMNSPHKSHRRGALMFSLICARTNGWVNNGDAGDFRRHCAHYDVTVIMIVYCSDEFHRELGHLQPKSISVNNMLCLLDKGWIHFYQKSSLYSQYFASVLVHISIIQYIP